MYCEKIFGLTGLHSSAVLGFKGDQLHESFRRVTLRFGAGSGALVSSLLSFFYYRGAVGL